ncbi:unnamed protein product [Discosporangium mesarthrocarpum]
MENVMHNNKVLDYSRTSLSAVGGMVSGILGLTGIEGLVTFPLIYAVVSLGLMLKMPHGVSHYTMGKGGAPMFLLGGIGKYALTYILFWTLAYSLVCVY